MLDELDDDEFESRPALPTPDFDFLVYSLRLQAELSLGLLPMDSFGQEPEKKPVPDFELARHNIDLLVMLQAKTKGNLTVEEQRALDNSVVELQFHFAQLRKEEPKPA
jgi:Domain of unknown function (DUF1844)